MKATPNRTRAIVLVAALVLIIGLPILFFPFGRDQGIHAYVGGSWLQGRLPFRDVWVQKGPLHFVPHLLVSALFGRTMWGIRLFDLVWQICCSWLLYLIARRRLRPRGALVAVALYLGVYFSLVYWSITHTEGFLALFLLLGIFMYERAQDSDRPWLFFLLSGCCIGFTLWIKQTAAVQVASLFAWAILDSWRTHERRFQDLVIRWTTLGLGVLLSAMLMLLFMSASGMLESMIDISRYSWLYYPKMSKVLEFSASRLIVLYGLYSLYWVLRFGLLAFPFIVGLVYLIKCRDKWKNWYGIVIMTLGGLVGIYAQGRLWDYHWVSTLPFMAMIAANAIDDGLDIVQQRGISQARQPMWLLIVGLAFAVPVFGILVTNYWNLATYLTGFDSRTEYLSKYSTPDFEINDILEAADYVRDRTTDQDPVFVWGHFAAIYYLSDRQNPTRFGMDPPLSLEHPEQQNWREEVIQDLEANPPAYILVATADATPLEPQTSKQQLPNFGELASFLENEYAFDRNIGDFEVYMRLDYEPVQ